MQAFLTGWKQDFSFACRMMSRNPGFTATAVLTLALGIGACTAIFSLVNGVLLRALPYEEPERLVMLWEDPSGKGQNRNSVAGAQFADWKEQNNVMENLSVIRRVSRNLTGTGRPERLNALQVSANYLSIFRVSPFLGRGFLPEEDQPGKEKVVVLSHRFWQRYFAADRNLVGRSILLDSESHVVIGILPAKPTLLFEGDIFLPFVYGSENWHRSRGDHRLRVIGRLKPGVDIEQARREMDAITLRLKSSYPSWMKNWGVTVVSIHENTIGEIRPQILLLFGAVGCVLLIACANVAGLLLARMMVRRKEIVIRAALGAGWWRVVRQLTTESVLLSSLGGALGVVLAYGGIRLIGQMGAESLPRVEEIGIDSRVLGFTLLTSLITGMLFGLVPALHLARPDLNQALRLDTYARHKRSGFMLHNTLIVAEIALALVLLVGSGLLMQTILRLQSVPPGFQPDGVLAMDLSLDSKKYPPGDRRSVFVRGILRHLESLPGVEAAGTATTLPMSGSTDSSVRAVNRPDLDEFAIGTDYDFVSGSFFRALGIPLLRGRDFTEQDDTSQAPRVAMISKTLADKMFPKENPLGQQVRLWNETWQIVGIVGDVRQRGPERNVKEHIYLPEVFNPYSFSLVVRTKVPPLTAVELIRKEILKLDPDQPVANVRTMKRIVAGVTERREWILVLLGFFAGAAMLLAAIGLYGMMAYTVSRQTREIGIRMALGARRCHVLSAILGRGVRLTGIGILFGLLGTWLLTRFLAHLLFGISPGDPVTYAGVILLLAAVALSACWLPARRATRIDPMTALRNE